jgi:hypothetical protein
MMKKDAMYWTLGFLGCTGIVFLGMVVSAAICLGITKLIQWGFHTPFPATFVMVILSGIVLSAIAGIGNSKR